MKGNVLKSLGLAVVLTAVTLVIVASGASADRRAGPELAGEGSEVHASPRGFGVLAA